MKRYGVIADDLTGATDTVAAFARQGFTTAVALGKHRLPSLKAQIIAVSTHSRHDAPDRARHKVRRALGQLHAAGLTLLYKKLDSTVQGNLVAEVEALRVAGGFATALVCPANPAQGRTVRERVLRIRGGRAVDLREYFQAQGLRDAGWITSPVTATKVAHTLQQGHPMIIADAVTRRDLDCLARTVWQSKRRVLLAGSAALAAELAHRLTPERGSRHGGTRGPAGLTLILTGTTNPVTERQIAILRKSTDAPPFELNGHTRTGISAALACQDYVVIRIPVHRQPDSAVQRHLRGLAPLFREGRVGSLVLTGGDTALLVCRWLRPDAIVIEGEISPGLAWGRFVGGLADGLAVCTKPGGFGTDRSLAAAVKFLGQ